MTTASEQRVLAALGDVATARHRLHSYRDTAAVLASLDLRLRYTGQWVAAFGGEVVGHSDDLALLLRSLGDRDIPRRDTVIRYVSEDAPEFI